MVASGRRWGPWGCPVAPCLQDQNSSAAQVRVIWRCGVPDSTTTSTPRRSPSLLASTKLNSLSDDFDAALARVGSTINSGQPTNNPIGNSSPATEAHRARDCIRLYGSVCAGQSADDPLAHAGEHVV